MTTVPATTQALRWIGAIGIVTVAIIRCVIVFSGQVVFDVVYTPLETRLLADAKSRGLMTISGVEMFVNQAVLQFEHFTGNEAPVEIMRRVVMDHLTS